MAKTKFNKTKRVELRLTPEFYAELEQEAIEFSSTMNALITNICRKHLNDRKVKAIHAYPQQEAEETIKNMPQWTPRATQKEKVLYQDGSRTVVKNAFTDE